MMTQQQLLQEILPTPSQTLITDRFSSASLAAGCSGHCVNGTCKGLLETDHEPSQTSH